MLPIADFRHLAWEWHQETAYLEALSTDLRFGSPSLSFVLLCSAPAFMKSTHPFYKALVLLTFVSSNLSSRDSQSNF